MIVSASGYGRGHEALADALVEELGVVEPSAEVVVIDGMLSTFGTLNRRGTAAYARQIADDPAGYGRGHELSGLPAPARALGRTIWAVATRLLAAEAREHRPDVVVSTHPFMTNALGRMRLHSQLAAPVLVPLHNLDPHPSWMAPGVDLHVANVPEDVPRIERNFRRAYQRAELRVRMATPPVDLRLHSQFSPEQRAAARRRFGLPEDAGRLARLPPRQRRLPGAARQPRRPARRRHDGPERRLCRCAQLLPGQGVAGAEALAGDGYGTLAREREELAGLARRLATGDPELVARAAKGRELYRQPNSTSQLIIHLGSSS
jgi:hypothetical protein